MEMPVPYEATGRTRQKARTRAALVDSARMFLREGLTPSVEDAADRAGISRTTAYRYFPNRHALLVATYPELDEGSLLGEAPPADPVARLEIVARRFTEQLLEHEPELRNHLRMSLEPGTPPESLPLRQGRAIGWIGDALEPLRETLSEQALRELVLKIRATLGIESFVWLTDVAQLSREDAVALMRDSAATLLRGAIADARRP